MKKHNWLKTMASSSAGEKGDKQAKERRELAFERVAADPGKRWVEDGFDEVAPWEQLSVRSKVVYLSWHAAFYEVTYDRFVEAVQNAVGEKGLAGGEQWSLKELFEGDVNEWSLQYEAARANLGPRNGPLQTVPEPEKNNGREM